MGKCWRRGNEFSHGAGKKGFVYWEKLCYSNAVMEAGGQYPEELYRRSAEVMDTKTKTKFAWIEITGTKPYLHAISAFPRGALFLYAEEKQPCIWV